MTCRDRSIAVRALRTTAASERTEPKTNTKSTSGPITLTNPKAGPETLDSRWWFKPDR
jgi:hypothetical protein